MYKNTFLQNLKDILAVPSYWNQEQKMIEHIESILSTIPDLSFNHDQYGNIYVTKGLSDHYPLVCAHTDTVHNITDYFIEEFESKEGPALKGTHSYTNEPSGCGGDNKTGVMVCLELLKSQDVIKAAFFFGEEQGFKGSALAEPSFFSNVGYCLEFDAPDYFWVSHICFGQELFEHNGEFWRIAKPIMELHTNGKNDPYNNNHPYTDVYPLKALYDFSCLNYSSGYMRMHSASEYVVVSYVERALLTAKVLLNALGNTKYPFVKNPLNAADLRIGDVNKFIKY